jgi:hypothetical protein
MPPARSSHHTDGDADGDSFTYDFERSNSSPVSGPPTSPPPPLGPRAPPAAQRPEANAMRQVGARGSWQARREPDAAELR